MDNIDVMDVEMVHYRGNSLDKPYIIPDNQWAAIDVPEGATHVRKKRLGRPDMEITFSNGSSAEANGFELLPGFCCYIVTRNDFNGQHLAHTFRYIRILDDFDG